MFHGLTAEDIQRRDVVRKMVDEYFRPLEDEIDRTDSVDPSTLRELRVRSAQVGVLGFNLPEDLGGAGLGYLSQSLLGVEMGRVTTALGHQVGHLPESLRFLDDQQREWLLAPVLTGERSLAYAVTESEGGSDLGNLRTQARKVDNQWVLTGSKHFISNAGIADHILVLAVTDGQAPLRERFTVFIVPRDVDGFSVSERYHTMGWRGHHLNALNFDSCGIPEDNVLGGVGNGFNVIMTTINGARLNVASRCVGAAERALAKAVAFATERRVGGNRLAELGVTQEKLANMDVQLQAATLLVGEAARCGDAEDPEFRIAVSRAKLFASEMANYVADTALQILGAAGYTTDYGVERILRDVRAFRIGEGTSEIQRIQIARDVVRGRRGA